MAAEAVGFPEVCPECDLGAAADGAAVHVADGDERQPPQPSGDVVHQEAGWRFDNIKRGLKRAKIAQKRA